MTRKTFNLRRLRIGVVQMPNEFEKNKYILEREMAHYCI